MRANQSAFLDENSLALVTGLFSVFATACISVRPLIGFKPRRKYPCPERAMIRNLWVMMFHQFWGVRWRKMGHFMLPFSSKHDRISNAVKARRSHDTDEDDQPLSMGTVVLISSFTSACAWIRNYPFDTVKIAMQAGLLSTQHGRRCLSNPVECWLMKKTMQMLK